MHQNKNDKRTQALEIMQQLKKARTRMKQTTMSNHPDCEELVALLHDTEDMIDMLVH